MLKSLVQQSETCNRVSSLRFLLPPSWLGLTLRADNQTLGGQIDEYIRNLSLTVYQTKNVSDLLFANELKTNLIWYILTIFIIFFLDLRL